MATITEIGPDLYRISTYVPYADLQFNQFLVKDDEPMLFHTGMRALFPRVRDALATIIDPSWVRWIAFSHFEADECGSLNEWLDVASAAEPVCSAVGALVSVNDFALRPARAMKHNEVLSTGKYRFRFLQTPHVPHAWEAGLMFGETHGALLCSDLFHQSGDVEPVIESNVVERARQTLLEMQRGPLANYLPYTPHTDRILQELADLKPKVCATMHGSTFRGDGESALRGLAAVLKEVLGGG